MLELKERNVEHELLVSTSARSRKGYKCLHEGGSLLIVGLLDQSLKFGSRSLMGHIWHRCPNYLSAWVTHVTKLITLLFRVCYYSFYTFCKFSEADGKNVTRYIHKRESTPANAPNVMVLRIILLIITSGSVLKEIVQVIDRLVQLRGGGTGGSSLVGTITPC